MPPTSANGNVNRINPTSRAIAEVQVRAAASIDGPSDVNAAPTSFRRLAPHRCRIRTARTSSGCRPAGSASSSAMRAFASSTKPPRSRRRCRRSTQPDGARSRFRITCRGRRRFRPVATSCKVTFAPRGPRRSATAAASRVNRGSPADSAGLDRVPLESFHRVALTSCRRGAPTDVLHRPLMFSPCRPSATRSMSRST